MLKDLVKLRRLIKQAVRDEIEALRLYENIVKEMEVTAERHARVGQTDAVLFLGLARNMEFIRNEEMKHYNYLKGLKL